MCSVQCTDGKFSFQSEDVPDSEGQGNVVGTSAHLSVPHFGGVYRSIRTTVSASAATLRPERAQTW
jgi:hypothetical protein